MSNLKQKMGRILAPKGIPDDLFMEVCKAIFSKFIPGHAQQSSIHNIEDTLEYTGWCEEFDEVPEGGIIPRYTAEYDSETKEVSFIKEQL